MEALVRVAIRRPVAVAVLAAVVALLGILSWRQLPVELFPDVEEPTVFVSIHSASRPAEEMEWAFGEAVERRLYGIRGLREVESVARRGQLLAVASLDWGIDPDLALVEVQKAVADLAADPEVDELLVRRWNPREAPLLVLGLWSPQGRPDLAELRRLARRRVATALEGLPGVAEVQVAGGRELEVRVQVDPRKLEAFEVGLATLEQRLREANADVEGGVLERDGSRYLVRSRTRFREPADVAGVVLEYRDLGGPPTPLRVADVATVAEVHRPVHHRVRVDGREGVSLTVYGEPGANAVEVAATVRQALADGALALPGVEGRVVVDRSLPVRRTLDGVRGAAGGGIVLAVAVLALFLRSAAPTIVVATAVPVSLLAAPLALRLSGGSLNLMTLGGLALAAGMLVDNAIVVVESISRQREAGLAPAPAAVRGTSQVAGALAAGTLTTCAVFLPVLFVRGAASRWAAGLAETVIVSLLVSLAVALLLVPAMVTWLLRNGGGASPARRGRRVEERVGRLVETLLRRPGTVVGAALLTVVLAAAALASLGSELLPDTEPRQLQVRLEGPPGQPLATTWDLVATAEEVLQEANGGTLAGRLSQVGRLPRENRLPTTEVEDEHTARLFLDLGEGGPPADAVLAAAAQALQALPGQEVSWKPLFTPRGAVFGGGEDADVVVELAGSSLENLERGARAVEEQLGRRPELWNVRSSLRGGPPELRLELDRAVMAGLGVGLAEVQRAVEASLDGRPVTTLSRGDEERPVVLRLPPFAAGDPESLVFRSEAGRLVPLAALARTVPAEGTREILRRGQQRVARVRAWAAPGHRPPEARQAARQALREAGPVPGLTARLAGREEARERTLRQLAAAGGLALLLIFIVLAGTFESLVHPFSVAAAVPLSLLGVAAVLVPVGRPLDLMAALGLIVLAGMAVNNSILLVDTARRLRLAGTPRDQAVVRATRLRLRPMLMTTCTTVLALLPLALGAGAAAELAAPLARVVAGGMLASLAGTLLVVPCVYRLLDGLSRSGPAPPAP